MKEGLRLLREMKAHTRSMKLRRVGTNIKTQCLHLLVYGIILSGRQ